MSSSISFPYRDKTPLKERLEKSQTIHQHYPAKCPLIITTPDHSEISLRKNRFIVPGHFTIGSLIHVVRRYIDRKTSGKEMPGPSVSFQHMPSEATFMFVRYFHDDTYTDIIPQTHQKISDVYQKYQDLDGFLYMFIMLENTYG